MEEIGPSLVRIPTISPDYYLGGERRISRHLPSREEQRRKSEINFLSLYNKEHPECPLSKEDEGLVTLQMENYGCELYFNPAPSALCNDNVIRMEKVQKGLTWVYFSASYWLKNGKIKKILTADTVLRDAACEAVVEKLFQGATYKGVFEISFNKLGRPYRVYQKGMKCLLMNLTNGMIFFLKKKEIPSLRPLEKRFFVGSMIFRSSTEYIGFERV